MARELVTVRKQSALFDNAYIGSSLIRDSVFSEELLHSISRTPANEKDTNCFFVLMQLKFRNILMRLPRR